MAVQIYLGEPPEHIKKWIVEHYGPTPPAPVSGKITLETEDGTTVEVDPPLTTAKLAVYKSNLVSISYAEGVAMPTESDEDLFVDFDKLAELSFEQDIPENIATLVTTWGLGITSDGLTTHLVVMYFNNGVVVINDADDSSGERGFRVDWNKFVGWLEDFDNSSLPEPGKSIIVPYKVDPNGSPVDTEWMILGYNKDIPRFVKYKNGDDRVYMDVLPGTALLTSFNGANVYSNKDGTGLIGTVSATGGAPFTYGNNNTYSVPRTITVEGTTYEFCGYNVTLQSKYGLVAKYDGNIYEYSQFRSYEKTNEYRSDWKTSEIREWLNGTNAVSTQRWYKSSDWNHTTGNIVGLLGRLTDADFTENIIPTVTRTWTFSSWRDGTEDSNGCQHLADKFRFLGVGEVNCKGTETTNYFPDGGASVDGENKGYDTSRFSEVFNETDVFTAEKSRKRRTMKEDGTKGLAWYWWLRSASSGSGGNVGCVYDYGNVLSYNANNYYAVLPVCLIG